MKANKNIRLIYCIISPALYYILASAALRAVLLSLAVPDYMAGFSVSALILPAVLYFFHKQGGHPGRMGHVTVKDLLKFSAFLAVIAFAARLSEAPAVQLSFIAVLGSALSAPICEELIYRGLIFDRCCSAFSPSAAALISSLLFAAAHPGIFEFILAFIAGLGFSWMRLHFKNLYVPIFAHIILNLSAFI